MMVKIPKIIKQIDKSFSENQAIAYENILVRMLTSPILFLAAIIVFCCRFFVQQQQIFSIIPDSLILVSFSVLIELYGRKGKNEKTKECLLTVIISIVMVFIRIRFYSLFGPAILTFCACMIVISIMRIRKGMLISILVVTFFLILSTFFSTYKFAFGKNVYFFGQAVSFLFLIIISAAVRQVISNRYRKIASQYKDIITSEKKLLLTLTSVGDGVITIDKNGRIEFINPVGEALTGWTLKKARGQLFDDVFYIINEYTRERVISPIKRVYETGKKVELTNHTLLISKDKSEKPIEDTAAPIKDDSGNVIGCVIVFKDYSESKQKQKRIDYLSYHDQLTGLYNRRFLEEELKRTENQPVSIIYASINGLRIINDAFGQESGDSLIQQIAETLKANCSSDDVIARTGGEEFVIMLRKTKRLFIEKFVNQLKQQIEQIKIVNVNAFISFGWDIKQKDNQSIWDIIKNAEDTMYRKKTLRSTSQRNAMIKSVLKTLLIKCPREEAHSLRVSVACEKIGLAYGLHAKEIRELKIAGELHDIGKIAVEDEILNKDSKLTPYEWSQIKKHPETGFRLLSTSSEFYRISEYILAHHERWDGTGYPKRLKGEDIPWKARVISIADAYDAMTCDRPYRKGLSKERAIAEIKKNAGTQFDPEIVKVFVEKVLGAKW